MFRHNRHSYVYLVFYGVLCNAFLEFFWECLPLGVYGQHGVSTMLVVCGVAVDKCCHIIVSAMLSLL